jgi:hypothetical protein
MPVSQEAKNRLRKDKEDVSVENRVARDQAAAHCSNQQKNFQGNATPPDRLTQHLVPARG